MPPCAGMARSAPACHFCTTIPNTFMAVAKMSAITAWAISVINRCTTSGNLSNSAVSATACWTMATRPAPPVAAASVSHKITSTAPAMVSPPVAVASGRRDSSSVPSRSSRPNFVSRTSGLHPNFHLDLYELTLSPNLQASPSGPLPLPLPNRPPDPPTNVQKRHQWR